MRIFLMGVLAFSCLGIAPAHAHAVFTNPQVIAGERSDAGLIITHGCDGSPTTSVTIAIPEGVTRVLPRALAG